jgi:hypothetical protein
MQCHENIINTCFWIDVSQYEPEIFPRLVYRMADPKIALLVFLSGKIILTGAKVPMVVPLSSLRVHGYWAVLIGPTCNTWDGVKCDGSDARITMLLLLGRGLTETLPAAALLLMV